MCIRDSSGTNLDRDITLSLTTGATLTVGGTVASATTTLAGGSTTIAGGSSTLSAGSTTLSAGSTTLAAAPVAGATNIKVASVSNFAVGQTINIDTGANLETRVITAVGTAGSGGTGITI